MPMRKSHDTFEDARKQALSELGLSGPVDNVAVCKAFRLRIKQANPDLHNGGDRHLRRLIMARDLLIGHENTSEQTKDNTSGIQTFYTLGDGAIPLNISLEQAIFGGVAEPVVPALEFAGTDETLTSLIQTKILHVTLPRGLRHGEKVHLKTQGAVKDKLYFEINIETPEGCRVWGDDIWMTMQVENRLMQNGGDLTIDTPHGPQTLRLDRKIATGTSVCLKDKGLPATRQLPAGDLHIRLEAIADMIRPAIEVLGNFRDRWASLV